MSTSCKRAPKTRLKGGNSRVRSEDQLHRSSRTNRGPRTKCIDHRGLIENRELKRAFVCFPRLVRVHRCPESSALSPNVASAFSTLLTNDPAMGCIACPVNVFSKANLGNFQGAPALFGYSAGVRRESSQQREADLRALQGHQETGRDSHHLQAQSKTQTEAGLIMARIAGVDLPREKKVEIGLTYIFGIGRAT